MKMPIKPSMLKIRRQSVKFIILHHTSELYKQPEARIDNQKFQTDSLFKGVMELKQGDVNYHYVIEKIKDDYIPIVLRPFVYLCDWDDIDPNINKRAIHVSILGNYDFKIPPKRLYEILSYKLLNPFMKMFHLTPSRIKFHRDVSSDKELSCPGDFLDNAVIEAMVRKFVLK